MIGTIIAGARIYDGLSPNPTVTDLGIVGDRIAVIGDLRERDTYERVAGGGLTPRQGMVRCLSSR